MTTQTATGNGRRHVPTYADIYRRQAELMDPLRQTGGRPSLWSTLEEDEQEQNEEPATQDEEPVEGL